jgi:hypothetical protein
LDGNDKVKVNNSTFSHGSRTTDHGPLPIPNGVTGIDMTRNRIFWANTSLQPADAVKNPVSLILVHHPKSDFNTPFIFESASAYLVCPDAVSTAKSYKGGF